MRFVQVTGASGFVGFEIAYELLEAGFSVVGWVYIHSLASLPNAQRDLLFDRSARGAKVLLLKQGLKKYQKFEAVEIADISSGDLTEALKGRIQVFPGPTLLMFYNTLHRRGCDHSHRSSYTWASRRP